MIREAWQRTVVAAVTWAAVSLAQPPTAAAAPSTTELEAARAAFGEGLTFEAQGRWADALDRFQRAAAVRASPQVSFHLGLCFEHVGRLVDALDAFVRVERDALGDSNVRRTGKLAERHVAALRKRLPVLLLHAPPSMDGTEPSVSLDGRALQNAMFDVPLPVDPGEHVVAVQAPGRATSEERFVARESGRAELTLRLGAELPQPPPGERAPDVTAPAKPVAVAAVDRPAPITARPKPARSRGSMTTPVILGSGALASFAAAGVFYGLRASAIADLRNGCADRAACPDDLRGVRDRGQTYTTAGNVSIALAATATVATAITFFVLRPTRTTDITLTARGPFLVVAGQL